MNRILTLVAITTVALAAQAQAALTASEPFATSGDLAGSNGGTGFSSAWSSLTAAGPGAAMIATPSLSAGALAASGGSATLMAAKNAGNDGSTTITRTLSTPIASYPDGGTPTAPTYVSFIAALDPNLLTSVSDAGQQQWGSQLLFTLADTSTNRAVSLGKAGGSANWNMSNTGLPGIGGNGPAYDANSALIVLKVTPAQWNVTSMSVWVNPSSLGGTEPTATLTASTNIGFSFSQVQLNSQVSGWLPITNGTLSNQFDEIRVGSTWADVTPVPEPTALGALVVSSLLALRRRRA